MKRFGILALILLAALYIVPCGAYAQGAHSPRNAYVMDIALDTQNNTIYEQLHITVFNDSAEAWNEIYLRNYMESIFALNDERSGVGLCEVDEKGNIVYAGPEPAKDGSHWSGKSGILSARHDGIALEVVPNANDSSVVCLKLNTPLPPEQSMTLDLEYSADIIFGGYRCACSALSAMDGHITYELAQFYPMMAVYENGEWICDPYFADGECMYTRCADYTVTLTLPSEYRVIASGHETASDAGEGLSTWKISAHDMRDIAIIVTNELDKISGEVQGIEVNSYYVKDDPASKLQGEISLAAALDSIRAFSNYYGAYPYAELDIVESGYEYGGMEAPELIRISQMYSWNLSGTDESGSPYSDKLKASVAHETAHQWFYGAVGDNQYREAWLDESFAAFSERLYWRAAGRSEAAIESELAKLDSGGLCNGRLTIDRSYAELGADYSNAVYQRGAQFLYRLEQALGSEAFRQFMHEYYEKYTFAEVRTADFTKTLLPYINENERAQALVKKYLSRP